MCRIDVPELLEGYPDERMVTSFCVDPGPSGAGSIVMIATVVPRGRGPLGWLEERVRRSLSASRHSDS